MVLRRLRDHHPDRVPDELLRPDPPVPVPVEERQELVRPGPDRQVQHPDHHAHLRPVPHPPELLLVDPGAAGLGVHLDHEVLDVVELLQAVQGDLLLPLRGDLLRVPGHHVHGDPDDDVEEPEGGRDYEEHRRR